MSTNGATTTITTTTTTNNNKCSNGAMGSSEQGLLHNVLISTEWTSVEQSLLEELLVKHASDCRELCYRKISKELQYKTSRDVACRCQWMTKKEIGRRRKDEEGSSRKQNNKREKTLEQQVKPSSHVANHANGLPSSSSSINNDDGINYKVIDGEIAKLLEQNAMALHQISVNFTTFKLQENINLFRQVRNNIDKISNEVRDMPEVMKRMPPLPMKLNEELANSILYRTQS